MALARHRANVGLPQEVNRIIYIRNLPYKISAEEMYDIFDKYGAISQVRVSGFNMCNRYLVVLYYQASKAFKKTDVEKKQKEIDKMKSKYGINT